MPKWLSSFLITVIVLALVALAMLPNSVVVNVNVENEFKDTSYEEHTSDLYRHSLPEEGGVPSDDKLNF